MKRNQFLKGLSLLGAGSFIPFKQALANEPVTTGATGTTTSCVLIPTETEGPFPLDLTTTNASTYFRTDIREDRTGVQLALKLRILGLSNCTPMTNVRVNVWHCDKDGSYSGYTTAQGNTSNTTGKTWLRGYQMTDAHGEVTFTTIFPGHYNGRTTHIHFQVFVSSSYKAVSQLTFDVTAKNALYSSHPSIYTNGTDPQSPATDNVFSDGYQYQTATLTQNADGTYSAFLEVSVSGSGTGTTGVSNIHEPETGGVFTLGQNYPNPHHGATTIPFSLATAAAVQIDLYDLNARKVGSVDLGTLGAGDHTAAIDLAALRLPVGNYLYQLQATTADGPFRQVKMMTAY